MNRFVGELERTGCIAARLSLANFNGVLCLRVVFGFGALFIEVKR
jgi:hypothetical protein